MQSSRLLYINWNLYAFMILIAGLVPAILISGVIFFCCLFKSGEPFFQIS